MGIRIFLARHSFLQNRLEIIPHILNLMCIPQAPMFTLTFYGLTLIQCLDVLNSLKIWFPKDFMNITTNKHINYGLESERIRLEIWKAIQQENFKN